MDAQARTLVLILALTCLAGCGGEDNTGGDMPQAPPSTEPVAKAPAPDVLPIEAVTVVMRFHIDVAGAKLDGRIPKTEDDDVVLGCVSRIAWERLQAADVGRYRLSLTQDNHLEVGFEQLDEIRHEEIAELVTRTGTLEFRIEVLPDAEYLRRLEWGDDAPPRLGLWSGSAEAFEAFKRSDIANWKKAQDEGAVYKPSNPAYRLVLEHDRDGSDPSHFHVLEEPKSDAERFGGRMLESPVTSVDQNNMPVVVFDVRKDWQERLGAWTAQNRLLPVAILLDGVYYSAPVIRSPLTTNVQISLGAGRRKVLEREAKQLGAALQAGSYPLAPTLKWIRRRKR